MIVAYILATPLNTRDYSRFGMQSLVAKGAKVIVLDASAIIHPHMDEIGCDESLCPGVTIHHAKRCSGKTLTRILKTADIVINLVGFTGSWASWRLYRALARSQRPWVAFSTNAYPGLGGIKAARIGLIAKAAGYVKRLYNGQSNPLRTLLTRLPHGLIGTNAPQAIFLGGRKSINGVNMYSPDESTKKLYIHSIDYEQRLELTANSDENIAVFIDEHMGFQRDIKVNKSKYPEDFDYYYNNIRHSFDIIEQKLGVRIVVAVNPRADYSAHPGLFGPREMLYGQTAALIAKSRLVIAHRSTAIGLAVMFGKPVLQLATRRQHAHWAQTIPFDAYAQALAKPIVFFDEPATMNLDKALSVDAQAYERFMDDYVKVAESGDGHYWDMVFDHLQAIISDKRKLTA